VPVPPAGLRRGRHIREKEPDKKPEEKVEAKPEPTDLE